MPRRKERVTGVVIAMPREARAILGSRTWRNCRGFRILSIKKEGGQSFMFTISGTGVKNSSLAAKMLVESGVEELVSTGVSGGLDPSLSSGDMIFSDIVMIARDAGRKKRYEVYGGGALSSSILTHVTGNGKIIQQQKILAVSSPVTDAKTKKQIWQETGAAAADMESAGVAMVADNAGMPFYAVRGICDSADEDLPCEIVMCLKENGDVRMSALALACARKPALVKGLFHMNRGFRKATEGLGKFWGKILC